MINPCLDTLAARIAARFGVDFSGFQRLSLEEAVSARRGPQGCAELLHLSDDELLPVVEAALNGETYFFRHEAHFEALRRYVLPELVRQRADARRLRVWSAGCSSGEEALSLAMVLRDWGLGADWDVQVLGTDLSRESLSRAQEGLYSEWSFRGVPPERRARHFVPRGERFEPSEAISRLVRYRRHNLLDGPPDRFDLVVCRNVLIYFRGEELTRASRVLSEALAPGGWLLTGPAEARSDLFPALEVENLGDAILFRRGGLPALRVEPEAQRGHLPPPAPAASGHAPKPAAKRPEGPVSERQRGLLRRVRQLAGRGEIEAAWRRVEEAVQAWPLAPEAHLVRAMVARERRQPAEAARSVSASLFLDPKLALGSVLLGDLLRAQGDAAGATRAYRNALDALSDAAPDAPVAGADDVTAGQLSTLARAALAELTRGGGNP